MKTRTLVATAVTGALIAGAVAAGAVFHQHARGVAAFDEAYDKLAEQIETVQAARGTATADLVAAQSVLDSASQPGALAQSNHLADLDAAVGRATEQIARFDDLLAQPEQILAGSEAQLGELFWRGDLDEAADDMLAQVYSMSAAGTPRVSFGPVTAVRAELDRTAEIVAIEEQIASTAPAQDSSGSYRAAAEKLATEAGYSVHQAPAGGDACDGTQPQREDVAAFVCPDTPEIYVIAGATADDDPYYDVMIRHELAHMLVYERCGSFDPLGQGDVFEGMTSSYAVLYLGGDRAELSKTHGEQYTMSAGSDSAARTIHDQGCTA
ncbi:hypothetical protein [Leucobacter chromiireducens]|uniref:hypothetical protein n=1 Tax=Leucobacter chromiireducens TaxID=283877 RepID=UPI003F7CDB40